MVALNVLSINGNTALADATYNVSERQVYIAYPDPTDATQTYVEIEAYGRTQRDVLLVDAAIADVLTSLNAGALGAIFLIMTLKAENGFTFPTAKQNIINMENIVVAYDFDSDSYVTYASENDHILNELVFNETISTISTAAAAATPAYPLTSKTVFEVNEITQIDPRVYLINQKYVEREIENFKDSMNTTATGTVKLKVETVISITAAGTGYQVNDDIALVGGTGTVGVLKVATIGGGGAITGVTITTAGSYSVLPTNIAAVPVTGGNGSGATFSIDFEVESIVITNAGNGYSSAPTPTISGGGGTGATATSSLSSGQVVSTTITAPGNNFTSIPTVAFTAPTAKTAWEVRAHQAAATRLYIF